MAEKRYVCQRCGNVDAGNTASCCVRCGTSTDMAAVTLSEDAAGQTIMTLGHPDPRQQHAADPRRQAPQ